MLLAVRTSLVVVIIIPVLLSLLSSIKIPTTFTTTTTSTSTTTFTPFLALAAVTPTTRVITHTTLNHYAQQQQQLQPQQQHQQQQTQHYNDQLQQPPVSRMTTTLDEKESINLMMKTTSETTKTFQTNSPKMYAMKTTPVNQNVADTSAHTATGSKPLEGEEVSSLKSGSVGLESELISERGTSVQGHLQSHGSWREDIGVDSKNRFQGDNDIIAHDSRNHISNERIQKYHAGNHDPDRGNHENVVRTHEKEKGFHSEINSARGYRELSRTRNENEVRIQNQMLISVMGNTNAAKMAENSTYLVHNKIVNVSHGLNDLRHRDLSDGKVNDTSNLVHSSRNSMLKVESMNTKDSSFPRENKAGQRQHVKEVRGFLFNNRIRSRDSDYKDGVSSFQLDERQAQNQLVVDTNSNNSSGKRGNDLDNHDSNQIHPASERQKRAAKSGSRDSDVTRNGDDKKNDKNANNNNNNDPQKGYSQHSNGLPPDSPGQKQSDLPKDLTQLEGYWEKTNKVNAATKRRKPAFWSEDIQVGCRELRARRYITDGFCTSEKAIKEVVCAGHCLPIKDMPWYAEFVKTISRTKLRDWQCVEDLVRRKRVKLLCQNQEYRYYRIKVVKSCKCKKMTDQHNRTRRKKRKKKRRRRKSKKGKDKGTKKS